MGEHRVKRSFGEYWVQERHRIGKFFLCFGLLTFAAAGVVLFLSDGIGWRVFGVFLAAAAVGKTWLGLHHMRA